MGKYTPATQEIHWSATDKNCPPAKVPDTIHITDVMHFQQLCPPPTVQSQILLQFAHKLKNIPPSPHKSSSHAAPWKCTM
eukprot:scaffold11699_cov138-Skeletonema_dohrnii-CCMP3373.AAC.6